MRGRGRSNPSNGSPGDEGLVRALQEGLAGLAQTAMAGLGIPERMVLALRFYEGMAEPDVAEILGYTEPDVRLRYNKAKRALNRELRRLGVTRSMFPAAMGAFGLMTLAPIGDTRKPGSRRLDGRKPSSIQDHLGTPRPRRFLGPQGKPSEE